MTETQLMRQILLALSSSPGVRVWRNHVAAAVPLRDSATVQRFGVPGSPDILGARTILVGGVPFARAIGVEVKAPTGRVSDLQRAWLEAHRAQGWLCGVARSVPEALAILDLP